MGMDKNCDNCTEKCPQAEMAHNAALGRMYATNELVSLLKKVESGNLVEVVRCKDCKHFGGHGACHYHAADENGTPIFVRENDFCSYGERRTDD